MEEQSPGRTNIVRLGSAVSSGAAQALQAPPAAYIAEEEMRSRASAQLRDLALSGEACETRELLLRLATRFGHSVGRQEFA